MSLSTEEYNFLNNQVNDALISFYKKRKVKGILIFLPIAKHREIDLNTFWNWCWEKGIEVFVPLTDFEKKQMRCAEFTARTQLEERSYGILEPKNCIEVSNSKISDVVVPLLAFTDEGYRVGYGGGFYDRFFQNLNLKIFKLGVSMFGSIPEIKNINEFDIPLDGCITPTKVYFFK